VLSRLEITHGEHPLSLRETSVWNYFFQDTEIIDQIDRDVKRIHPDMHFFSGVKYVQGMDEILAPLFYLFKNDPDEENAVSI